MVLGIIILKLAVQWDITCLGELIIVGEIRKCSLMMMRRMRSSTTMLVPLGGSKVCIPIPFGPASSDNTNTWGLSGKQAVCISSGESPMRNNSIWRNSRGYLLLITSLYGEQSDQSHRCCSARVSVSISWLFGSVDINAALQRCKNAQGLLFCPSSFPKLL